MKSVSSLISGVGIFCVGTGLSMYHGIHGLLFPNPVESFYWAYFILGGSLVSEGATLLVAINSIKKGAIEKRKSFREYVINSYDPSVNVVLMEDFAAVSIHSSSMTVFLFIIFNKTKKKTFILTI